jgi:hypothetical protein
VHRLVPTHKSFIINNNKIIFALEQVELNYSSTLSLTSALDGVGGQRHAPAALRPGTHCTGGRVDPRAGMDGCGKSRSHRDSIPGPSSP